MYQFVREHNQQYPIGILCQVVGVSRSAYYAYITGQTYQPTASKKQQYTAVNTLFTEHKRRYGSRRIVKALRAKGKR